MLASLLRFHHLGLACRDISAELASLKPLGYEPEGSLVTDTIQQVDALFLVGGGPRVELIAPTSETSPVNGVINRGNKIYHVGYFTPDFDKALELLDENRFRALGPVAPGIAYGMRRLVFMMSPTMNLIEIIEAEN